MTQEEDFVQANGVKVVFYVCILFFLVLPLFRLIFVAKTSIFKVMMAFAIRKERFSMHRPIFTSL